MDSESALVGMAVYDSKILPKIRDRVPDTYYLDKNDLRCILQAVYELHENDKDISPVTVAEEMEGELLREIGGTQTIADLAKKYSVMDKKSLETIIDDVVENYIERETQSEIVNAKRRIDDGENCLKVIQDLGKKLDDLQSKKTTGDIKHVSDSMNTLYDMLEEANETGALPGTLKTGFSDLDDRIKGIGKNDLILLSADTGLGKTSLALQMADTVASGQDKNVCIFSGEMHGWEILMKILSKRGVATLDEMQDGELNDDQWNRIVNERTKLKEDGLYTIRESQPTIYDFRSALREADSEHGIDLAVLDYIQMLKNPSPESMDTVEHLNMVSSELRDFTNDFDIPVLAISRENKGGEIYGSSQLKYDCNYRIVIKDPAPENDDDPRRLFKVEKARLAKGGNIKMMFQGENSRFVRANDEERDIY